MKSEQIRRIADSLVHICEKENSLYKAIIENNIKTYGINAALNFLEMQLYEAREHVNQDNEMGTASLYDKLLDLAAYSIFTAAEVEKKNNPNNKN